MRNEGSKAFQQILIKAGVSKHQYQQGADQIWENYLAKLCQVIEKLNIPSGHQLVCNVHAVKDLEAKKIDLIGRGQVINMDAYGSSPNQIALGVSRIFSDMGNKKLGIGARPGYPSLNRQLKNIPTSQTGYILVEDDIFSGRTMQYILDMFKKHQVKINRVVVGCQIGNIDTDIPIKSVFRYAANDVHDLNDPRDFLMGSHEGGLVVQHQKRLYRVPYLLPLIDVGKRIGVSSPEAIKFSRTLWGLNQIVFADLEKLVNKPILIKHLGKFCAQYLTEVVGFKLNNSVISVCKRLESRL